MRFRTYAAIRAASILALTGCSSADVPTIDCATATVTPYSQLGSVMANCTGCHSGANAPHGHRYDTYADAKKNAEEGQQEIANGSMPPEGTMSDADKEAFYAWAQCGTPE